MKKIKNIIKKDKEIWIGTFVCIIILTMYILLSGLSGNRIFLILVNLSFSYIAAVIFYIVQVKIPDKKKTEKALLTFQGDLSSVYDELEMIIIYIDEFWSLKGNKLTIKELDNNIHYYLYEKNKTKFKEYIHYKEYILLHISNLRTNLEKLRNIRLYQYLPEELIDNISELENERFASIITAQNNYYVGIECEGLQKNIDRIRKYINTIKPYLKNNNVYKLRGLNNDEKNEYKKELELCKRGIINLRESEKILYREE